MTRMKSLTCEDSTSTALDKPQIRCSLDRNGKQCQHSYQHGAAEDGQMVKEDEARAEYDKGYNEAKVLKNMTQQSRNDEQGQRDLIAT